MKKYLVLPVLLLIAGLCYLAVFPHHAPPVCVATWAQEQMQEDLAPFAEGGIRHSTLVGLMQESAPKAGLLHVQIKKGACRFSSDQYFSSSERTRVKHIKKFFNSLARRYLLPDVEFVICVLDAYEASAPVWVFAKKKDAQGQVLMPDFEALNPGKRLVQYKQAAADHPWQTKQEVVFWRGATTGGIYELDNYLEFPRVKLVFLSKEHPQWLDAAFSVLCQSSPAVLETILRLSRPLAPYVDIPGHFAFKYLIDIDGNSCTYARCRWILLSNSVLLKPASSNVQWYYKALEPHVHYMPLKQDLSDLELAYQWLKAHDEQAEQMAEAGRELGLALFSERGIQEYVAALIVAYHKLYRADE